MVEPKALEKLQHLIKKGSYINDKNYDCPIVCFRARYLNNSEYQKIIFAVYPTYLCVVRTKTFFQSKYYVEKWENCISINYEDKPMRILMTFTGKPIAHKELDSTRRSYTITPLNENFNPISIFKEICNLINSFSHPDGFPSSNIPNSFSPYFTDIQKAVKYAFCTANKLLCETTNNWIQYLEKYPHRINFDEFGEKGNKIFPYLVKTINAVRTVETIRIDFPTKYQKTNISHLQKFLSSASSVKHLIIGGNRSNSFPIKDLKYPFLNELTFDNIEITADFLEALFKSISISPSLTKISFIKSLSHETFMQLCVLLRKKNSLSIAIDHIIGKKKPALQEIYEFSKGLSEFEISNVKLKALSIDYIISNTDTSKLIFGGFDLTKNLSVTFRRPIEKVAFPDCKWSGSTLITLFKALCVYNLSNISIDISGMVITKEELHKFYDELKNENYRSDYITEIKFDKAPYISLEFIQFILRCRNLRSLSLRLVFLEGVIGVGLLDVINFLPIRRLDLTGNRIEHSGMEELCKAISASRTLTEINLGGHRCKNYDPFEKLLIENCRIVKADVTSALISLPLTEKFFKNLLRNRKCSLDLSWPFAAALNGNWKACPQVLEECLSLRDLSSRTGVECEPAFYPPDQRGDVMPPMFMQSMACVKPPDDLILKFTKIDDDNPYADIDLDSIASSSIHHWEESDSCTPVSDPDTDTDPETISTKTEWRGVSIEEIAKVCGVGDSYDERGFIIALPSIPEVAVDVEKQINREFPIEELLRGRALTL